MKTYREIVGDGGSGVAEQMAALRARVEDNLAGVRYRVAVGSGKGGVGKSTVTAHLARCLQEQGWRVAILDADLNGPCQARLAGLAPSPPVPGSRGLVVPRGATGVGVLSLGSFLEERAPLEFESVAQGDTHVWRATREFGLLGELLASAEWGELDLLLLDLPPGVERTVQYATYLGPAARVLLITTPSGLAQGVVARSLEALRREGRVPVGYVENMSGYYCEGCRKVQPLFPRSAAILDGLPCLGSLPFDPVLASAEIAGAAAAHAHRPAVRALRAAARRLREALEAREAES